MLHIATAIAAAALAAPTSAAEQHPHAGIAAEFADFSTRICYRAAAGEIAVQSADLAEEMRLIGSLGLDYGVPTEIVDGFGPGMQSLVNRATLASRRSGDYRLVVAAGGTAPGCRVLLTGAYDATLAEAVAGALGAAGSGWTAIPELTQDRGVLERRTFVRRDAAGRAFLLDLITIRVAAGTVRAVAMIGAKPESVVLPSGY